jgi:hypothetical protein
MDFFLPSIMNTPDHGTKSDPIGTIELCPKMKIFSPKNQSGSRCQQ